MRGDALGFRGQESVCGSPLASIIQSVNYGLSTLNQSPISTLRINGLTHLNLTKLDVLSDLDEIKVGLRYRAKDGTILASVPADLETLEGVTVRVCVGGGLQ